MTETDARRRLAHIESAIVIQTRRLAALEGERDSLLDTLADYTGCSSSRPMSGIFDAPVGPPRGSDYARAVDWGAG